MIFPTRILSAQWAGTHSLTAVVRLMEVPGWGRRPGAALNPRPGWWVDDADAVLTMLFIDDDCHYHYHYHVCYRYHYHWWWWWWWWWWRRLLLLLLLFILLLLLFLLSLSFLLLLLLLSLSLLHIITIITINTFIAIIPSIIVDVDIDIDDGWLCRASQSSNSRREAHGIKVTPEEEERLQGLSEETGNSRGWSISICFHHFPSIFLQKLG